ncbi:hypothetical protein STVA_35260 [Allostella vacuolata]|nr:hypothetical protein STVA_35260 [Stella vacuolata]
MARDVRVTGITLEAAATHKGRTDLKRLAAMTDADIDRQCMEDPDLVRDVTDLGEPLPDVKAIRKQLGMAQETLAAALGLPLGTLRNWEQRRSVPGPAGISLLRIVAREPAAAFRALGVNAEGKRTRGTTAKDAAA